MKKKLKINIINTNKEYKFVSLYNWLETQLVVTDCKNDSIKRSHLQNYVLMNYFPCPFYIQNIDYVKQGLQIYFMLQTEEQNSKMNVNMLNIEIKTKSIEKYL
jgi:hypothetical protein